MCRRYNSARLFCGGARAVAASGVLATWRSGPPSRAVQMRTPRRAQRLHPITAWMSALVNALMPWAVDVQLAGISSTGPKLVVVPMLPTSPGCYEEVMGHNQGSCCLWLFVWTMRTCHGHGSNPLEYLSTCRLARTCTDRICTPILNMRWNIQMLALIPSAVENRAASSA